MQFHSSDFLSHCGLVGGLCVSAGSAVAQSALPTPSLPGTVKPLPKPLPSGACYQPVPGNECTPVTGAGSSLFPVPGGVIPAGACLRLSPGGGCQA